MNLEIVACYESDRNDSKELINGTLHVHLIDVGIDLRGIYFSKRKSFWYFRIPNRKIDGGGHYPVIALRDRSVDLVGLIKQKAKSFIEDYIKANPELPKQQQQGSQSMAHKNKDSSTGSKETALIASKPAIKQWMDPPPIKGKARNH